MPFGVFFGRQANAQLEALEDYIAREASAEIAERFVQAILDYCGKLCDFPHRGSPRDDIRPSIRTLSFRRRVTIAYAVDGSQVVILGIFYGGQDLQQILRDDDQLL